MAPTTRSVGKGGRKAMTQAQRNKDAILGTIHNRWIRTSRDPKSRDSIGLHRPTQQNFCYRIVVLQALLHLPRFMNWILSHKTHKDAIPQDCDVCAMKLLIRGYWGNLQTHGFDQPHQRVSPLVRQLYRIIRNNPTFGGNHEADPAELLATRSDVKTGQGLLQMLTTAGVNAGEPQWAKKAKALFRTELEEHQICQSCKDHHRLKERKEYELRIPYIPGGPQQNDLVADIRDYYFNGETEETCKKCNVRHQHTLRRKIQAAPEILLISLFMFDYTGKNMAAIDIPETLDLTAYNEGTDRIEYKLSSVIAHSGQGTYNGHYHVRVQGPQKKFLLNDGNATAITDMATNPYSDGGQNFNSYVLAYVRQRK